MIVVQVKHNPNTCPTKLLNRLSDMLPHIIARALTASQENALAPNDVQVWMLHPHAFDNLSLAFQIMIHFPTTPGCEIDLKKSRKEIASEILKAFDLPQNISMQIGWVWLIPVSNSEMSGF
jgi:hypothetical protein